MSDVSVTLSRVAPTPVVTLQAINGPVFSLAAALPALVLTLALASAAPVVALSDSTPDITLALASAAPVVSLSNQMNLLNPGLPSIQVALQAFMQGEAGPAGLTPQITITVHSISTDLQPSITAGGTALAPTFDIGIPSGATFNIDEFVAQTNGAITRVYATAPSPSTKVFINGLRQGGSNYTVSGDEVLLSASLSIESGDFVQIDY